MKPTALAPATPSELLSHIIAHHRYPTTVVIGFSKAQFLQGLVQDVHIQTRIHQKTAVSPQHAEDTEIPPPAHGEVSHRLEHEVKDVCADQDPQPYQHPLLQSPLMQMAVSRHIRIVFTPTVAHLRAFLSAFATSDSKIAPPPNHVDRRSPARHQPMLAVYGFLEVHRDGSEWSAQGLGISAAVLIEAAVATSFQPVVVEPTGAGGHEQLGPFLDEGVPLLNVAENQNDGLWSGRAVVVRRVLGRWFDFQETEDASSL